MKRMLGTGSMLKWPLDVKRNKVDILTDNTGSLDDLNEQFQKVLIEVSKPFT